MFSTEDYSEKLVSQRSNHCGVANDHRMHSKPSVDALTALSCSLARGYAEVLLEAQAGSTYDKKARQVDYGKNYFLESNERAKSADESSGPTKGNNCQTHTVRKKIL